MRRSLATLSAILMLSSVPAYAQTAGTQPIASSITSQGNAGGGSTQSGSTQDGTLPDGQQDGLGALAQATTPPPPNLGPLLIGTLAVGGMVTGIVLATQNHNNNNTTTTATSP